MAEYGVKARMWKAAAALPLRKARAELGHLAAGGRMTGSACSRLLCPQFAVG